MEHFENAAAQSALHNQLPRSPRLHLHLVNNHHNQHQPYPPPPLRSDERAIIPADSPPLISTPQTSQTEHSIRVVGSTKYHILDILGTGGQGTVFKVSNPHPEKWPGLFLALKQFNYDPKHPFSQRSSYQAEKRALEDMDASIFRDKQRLLAFDDAKMSIVIPFVEGRNLKDVMASAKNSQEYMQFKAAYDLLASRFHRRFNRIHGDIRPLNVMVKPNGVLELVDFGMSVQSTSQKSKTFDSNKATFEWDLALSHIRAIKAGVEMTKDWKVEHLYRTKEHYDMIRDVPGMEGRAHEMRVRLVHFTGLDLERMEIVHGQLVIY
jgi:serine/threonine protein kinase